MSLLSSPTSASFPQLNETKAAVQVTFTMLETPSLIADVEGNKKENTMDAAVSAIRTTLDKSQLIILVKFSNKPDEVSCLRYDDCCP